MTNILYVFSNQTRSNVENNNEYSSEFFYGYKYLKDSYETNYIEFNPSNHFLKIVDKVLTKISNIPFYFSHINSIDNYKKINQSTHVILVNQRAAIAALPMIYLSKILKNKKIYFFNMGLFQKKLNLLDKFFVHLLLKTCTYIINLGYNEHKYSINNYQKFRNKFIHMPFPVDLNFWMDDKKSHRDSLLFVGNDSNRDFYVIEELAHRLQNIKFNIITKAFSFKRKVPKNVNYISGTWGSSSLSDLEMSKFYQNSLLTLIPLKNTLQPSGQSVAQQSLACGTPVLMSKTIGIWTELLVDEKNIYLIDNNEIDLWEKKVTELLSKDHSEVIKNSNLLLKSNFSLNKFNKDFESLLFSNLPKA